jgi:hypothetical protein
LTKTSTGWQVADNAPHEFYVFMLTLPTWLPQSVVRTALIAITNKEDIPQPPPSEMFVRLAATPELWKVIDHSLSGRVLPRSMKELLAEVHRRESNKVLEYIGEWLNSQITY